MWDLKLMDTNQSLYIAIADALERDVRLGILKAGEKLPPQRKLAVKVGVNVTTVTRAYKDAEKRGLITSIVGSGTYVSSDRGVNPSLMNIENSETRRIEMGLVLPLYSQEPELRPILEKAMRGKHFARLTEYTPPQGLYRHRLIGSEWMRRFGVSVGAENVVLTAGAQHALICIFSSVFQPGDRVAVDCLTYPGVKTAAKLCGIQLEAVEMDSEGITPRGLEGVCKRHDVKGLYTVAAMQNPTNSAMSCKRREAIAEMIDRYQLILVEDDLYRFLSPEPTGTLTQLAPEQGIYIAGISKAFYAGLRICFVGAPARFCGRIAQAVVDTVWMASALNAEMACECITSGLADEMIAFKREEIRRRAALMADQLAGYRYRYTPDSMFAWLTLPEDWDGCEFEKAAADHGVHIVASERFAVGGIAPPNAVRISLTGAANATEYGEGITILRRILDREIGPEAGVN